MKTILVLIDFSDVTSKVLDQAHALARAFDSEIVLCHVVPEELVVTDFAVPPDNTEVFEARQRKLMEMRASLQARDVNATARQFRGPLLNTLLEEIELLVPDLIIMGSHGHGALYHLLMGSVTEGIIKHATAPVMVVPSVPVKETAPLKKLDTTSSKNPLSTLKTMPVPP